MKKEQMKTNGITLIALVVTIIVLLILAGVAISLSIGDNGIFKRAKEAEKIYTEKAKEEEEMLDNFESSIVNLETGKYVGGQFNEEKGVNTPKLADGLIAVKFNEDGRMEDVKNPNTDNSWYDYKDTSLEGEGTSRWANARTANGSLFVWIPRYAYKIENRLHLGYAHPGKISIKFLKGTTNEYSDNSGQAPIKYPEISNNAMTDFVLHPAFGTDLELGGWDRNLEGIWVAKFEASMQDATKTSEGSSNRIVFQPNVKSVSTFSLDEKYKKSYDIFRDADSHLMKNSEWGCVAYLAQSSYGRNGIEVTVNDNPEIITGGGDFANNVNQSTTGNLYGIYDMSGGNFEVVACYMAAGTENLDTVSLASRETDPKPKSSKYVTVYKCGEIINYEGFGYTRFANYEYNSNMFGDAMYETSEHASIGSGSWFKDTSYYMIAFDKEISKPATGEFLSRSGTYEDAEKAGLFYFCNNGGSSKGAFRATLCP